MAATITSQMENILSGSDHNDTQLYRGGERVHIVEVPIDGSEANGHLFPLVRMLAHDRITSVKWLSGADYTSNADTIRVTIGLYATEAWTTASTGTALGGDIYAHSWNMAASGGDTAESPANAIELLGLGTNAIDAPNFFRQLWEDAGESVAPPPGTEYDLVANFNSISSATAGTNVLIVKYIPPFGR